MKFKDYIKEARIPKEKDVDDKGIEKGSKSIFSKLKLKEPSKEEKNDKLKQSRVDAEEERNLNKALAAGLDVKIPGVDVEEKKTPFGGKGGGVELSGKKEKEDENSEDSEDKDEKSKGEKPENPFAKKDDTKDTEEEGEEDEECEDDDEECLKKKKKKEKLKEDKEDKEHKEHKEEYKADFFSLI